MAEDDVIGAVSQQVGEFDELLHLVASSESLQAALVVLIIGTVGIAIAYRKFSHWMDTKKFSYARPHLARLVRVGVLPLFAIALISSMNAYIQLFELFPDAAGITSTESQIGMTTVETFSKILNTINILVIGYTIAHIIPILLTKRNKSILERDDFEAWRDMRGFPDDDGDLFHVLFKWNPPPKAPEDLSEDKFREHLKTEEGRLHLESFTTSKGYSIGSYEARVKDPFEKWKISERKKYHIYYDNCVNGKNESGKKLKPGQHPQEIYPIDTWREEKRVNSFNTIIPGYRPPGYAEQKRKHLPKSVTQILPVGIFIAVVLGVVGWWGVDLFVLATATGGLAIGVGLALQETMQNWFAYIMIRKDKIISEGDRIQLESGYNGNVFKITNRVTYIQDALKESFAIIPTRQLINAQVINYTREPKAVPAIVNVGASYLNDPRTVAAILVKVGRRAMKEAVDDSAKHLVIQKKCPYLEENKPSCGCDTGHFADKEQPIVRFNEFNDSTLDFSVWVYVRDYGSQFKTKTIMRMILYEEFKKYDIRIPWPIRTIYEGDEKRETKEIGELDAERDKVFKEYGIGDLGSGKDDGSA